MRWSGIDVARTHNMRCGRPLRGESFVDSAGSLLVRLYLATAAGGVAAGVTVVVVEGAVITLSRSTPPCMAEPLWFAAPRMRSRQAAFSSAFANTLQRATALAEWSP